MSSSYASPFISQKEKQKEENFWIRNGKIQSDLKKGDTEEVALSDVTRTLSQEKKCKVTLYDKVGNIVIIIQY